MGVESESVAILLFLCRMWWCVPELTKSFFFNKFALLRYIVYQMRNSRNYYVKNIFLCCIFVNALLYKIYFFQVCGIVINVIHYQLTFIGILAVINKTVSVIREWFINVVNYHIMKHECTPHKVLTVNVSDLINEYRFNKWIDPLH